MLYLMGYVNEMGLIFTVVLYLLRCGSDVTVVFVALCRGSDIYCCIL